jgi:hypothetical protein
VLRSFKRIDVEVRLGATFDKRSRAGWETQRTSVIFALEKPGGSAPIHSSNGLLTNK